MKTKDLITKKLNEAYGGYKSKLEVDYFNKLTDNLMSGDINKQREWLTYNQVVLELKNTLNDIKSVEELQYYLYESVKPNITCVELLKKRNNLNDELVRLYNKILSFK